jgi:hypothetical protein
MDAIRDAVIEARLAANPANAANTRGQADPKLATFANLAISQQHGAHIDPAVTELLDAAMRACDAWNDTAQARDQMRRECLETPPHLRADLLAHLTNQYPKDRA